MTVKEVLKYKLYDQKHFIALAFIQSELSTWVKSVGIPITDHKCIEMAESFEALLDAEELENDKELFRELAYGMKVKIKELEKHITQLENELRYERDEHGC